MLKVLYLIGGDANERLSFVTNYSSNISFSIKKSNFQIESYI